MWNAAPEAPAAVPPAGVRSDDRWLGSVLVATWALRTGRTPRLDVPCGALTADELITFWADPWLDEPSPTPADGAAESRVVPTYPGVVPV